MKSPHLNRRRVVGLLGASAGLAAAGCSTQPKIPPSLVAAIAPTGRLRASINLGNPVLASKDPATGQPVGVSVDLARALAKELNVPVELVVFDAAARSVEAVTTGQADIGFFAIDPLRGEGIRFSAAYVLIEGGYLVRGESPIKDVAQVDRPGTKIMVGKGSAYDLYLSRALKSAQLLRTPTSPAVVDEFLRQEADVAAGVKQQLEADASRIGGLRVLPGRFMVIEQAMGIPSNRGDAAQKLLKDFVESAKARGLVADSLRRNNVYGAIVAPAAGT